MKGPYDDIIELPHPGSKRHRPMSLPDRAAQFAPFAALTGFGDEIEKAARQHLDEQPSMYAPAEESA